MSLPSSSYITCRHRLRRNRSLSRHRSRLRHRVRSRHNRGNRRCRRRVVIVVAVVFIRRSLAGVAQASSQTKLASHYPRWLRCFSAVADRTTMMRRPRAFERIREEEEDEEEEYETIKRQRMRQQTALKEEIRLSRNITEG